MCREWVATHRDELNPIEGAFLAASEEAERQREQDKLENERRLREAAEAIAAEVQRTETSSCDVSERSGQALGSRHVAAWRAEALSELAEHHGRLRKAALASEAMSLRGRDLG